MQHGCISTTMMRRVWATVTAHPTASVRELAELSGYSSFGYVSRALSILRDYGYIEYDDRTNRARRVIVPFVQMERTP